MLPRALILVLAAAPMSDLAHAAAPMTWQVEKRRDAETGLRSCHVRSLGGHVTAVLAGVSPPASPAWSVKIGFDNRSGSLRYLRVGRSIHQTDAAAFRGPEAEAIVARLKAPGEFVFEWELGPGAAKQGGLFSTGDFAEKASLCEHWIAGARAEHTRYAHKSNDPKLLEGRETRARSGFRCQQWHEVAQTRATFAPCDLLQPDASGALPLDAR